MTEDERAAGKIPWNAEDLHYTIVQDMARAKARAKAEGLAQTPMDQERIFTLFDIISRRCADKLMVFIHAVRYKQARGFMGQYGARLQACNLITEEGNAVRIEGALMQALATLPMDAELPLPDGDTECGFDYDKVLAEVRRLLAVNKYKNN